MVGTRLLRVWRAMKSCQHLLTVCWEEFHWQLSVMMAHFLYKSTTWMEVCWSSPFLRLLGTVIFNLLAGATVKNPFECSLHSRSPHPPFWPCLNCFQNDFNFIIFSLAPFERCTSLLPPEFSRPIASPPSVTAINEVFVVLRVSQV